jgi:hypothetical protein
LGPHLRQQRAWWADIAVQTRHAAPQKRAQAERCVAFLTRNIKELGL